jgi:hypothetical protein
MLRTRTFFCCIALLLASGAIRAKEAAPGDKPDKQDKELSGISILGNDDAPKSLVIVPWKSSALGDALDISRALDDGRQPVDRDVFMRELDYYQIRAASEGAGSSGAQ